MKRFLVLGSALLLCGLLPGCGPDTLEGLLSSTSTLIDQSATEVGLIKTRVNEAVKKVEKGDTNKLDLSEAVKAAAKLKQTGEETQKIKQRIEQVRATVTTEQKKAYAKQLASKLNDVFKTLLEQKRQLRESLAAAEKLGPQAKAEVDLLRKKIDDAESPFESLARQ